MELSKEQLKTGAKKALVATSLVLALVSSLTPVAYAEVNADNIIGDTETVEDRSVAKSNDMISIINRFKGIDLYGNPLVTVEDVKKAIELSNALNSFYYDQVAFTNTKPSEVTSLNVRRLYQTYNQSRNSGNPNAMANFCINNLTNKPAIDAFITFGAGNVADSLKACVATRLYSELTANGATVNFGPAIVINENEFYALAEVNGSLKKIVFLGEECEKIQNLYTYLESTYQTALNNIAGYSDCHDLSFMYNGIEYTTNESAWLSLPDDDKKEMIQLGINYCEHALSAEEYTLTSTHTTQRVKPTDLDKEIFKAYSYQIKRNATLKIEYVSIDIVKDKVLVK